MNCHNPEDPQLEKDSTNVQPETIPYFRSNFNELNWAVCVILVNFLMYHFDKFLNKELSGYDFNMTKQIKKNNYVNTGRFLVTMEEDFRYYCKKGFNILRKNISRLMKLFISVGKTPQ